MADLGHPTRRESDDTPREEGRRTHTGPVGGEEIGAIPGEDEGRDQCGIVGEHRIMRHGVERGRDD